MAFKFDAQAAADTLAQIDQNRFAQQQFNLKKDELAFNREMMALNSYLDQKKAYSTKPKKGYDTQSLIDARNTLKSYIEDIDPEDMDEATKKIITQAQEEPHLAVDIVNFIKDQAKNYQNVIKITELPTLINIIENPKLDDEQKFDFVKELDLIDINDRNQFKELMIKIKNLSGSELGIDRDLRQYTLVTDPSVNIDTVKKITQDEKQIDAIGNMLFSSASTFVRENAKTTDPLIREQVIETQNAIKNLSNKDLKGKSIATFMKYYLEPQFIYDLMQTPAYSELSKNTEFTNLLNIQGIKIDNNNNIFMEREVTQDLVNINPSLQDYIGQIITFIFNPQTGLMQPNI